MQVWFDKVNAFLHLPLFWLVMCLIAFYLGQVLYRKSGFNSFLTPVITATVLLIGLLLVTHVPYETFTSGTSIISFFLGPATVSLAVPIYEQRAKLAKLWLPLGIALTVGTLVGMLAALGLALLFGLSHDTVLSLIPKSVTAPIAMNISETLGGLPDLTAAVAVITGVFGASAGPHILRLFKLVENPARGAALGCVSHGIGTSAAFQLSEEAGAFAGLAMGLTGVLAVLFAPTIIAPLLAWLGVV